MDSKLLHDLATRGAAIRLSQIDTERREILEAFPNLRAVTTPATPVDKWTTAKRAEVSARMKAYWAARKAAGRKAKRS